MSRPDWLNIATCGASVAVTLFTTGFVRLGFVVVAVVLAALFIWRRAKRSNGADEPRIGWQDLEARFKDLRKKEIALSWEKRVAGEISAHQLSTENGLHHWMLFGPSAALKSEAETLCRLAGSRLLV